MQPTLARRAGADAVEAFARSMRDGYFKVAR
jgi:hypothetical protein